MRRLLPLLLTLACSVAVGSPLEKRPWFHRPVVEPTEANPNPTPEAWRPVGWENTPWGDQAFSLVDQLRKEGAPDPFLPGTDMRALLERDWELATTFELEALPEGRFDLVSDSSSPVAEVYVNGQLAGRLDRAFSQEKIGRSRLSIKPHVKEGRNDLLIRLLAPGPEAARRHAVLPRNLPDGPPVTVRAPRMIFGSEVAPPLASAWLNVEIDDAPFPYRLIGLGRVTKGKDAVIEAVVEVDAPAKGRLGLRARTPASEEPREIASVAIPEIPGRHTLHLTVADPRGPVFSLGKKSEAPTVVLEPWLEAEGFEVDSLVRHRLIQGDISLYADASTDTRLDSGAPGRPAVLVSGGKRVPIRGVSLVPSQLAYGTPRHAAGRSGYLMDALAHDSFNLIRIWGGGGVASGELLESAWSNGIAVWVELPFVRGLFPGDEAFAAEAEREMDAYLRFLQRFPCVVAISGSAETARYRQGDVIPGLRNARETAEVRADQVRLFDQRLRALVARRLPHVTYLPYGETPGSGDMTVRTAVSAPSPLTADRWKLGNGLRWPEGRGGELELGRRLGEAGLRNPGEELLGFASRWIQAEDLRLQLDRVRARGPEEGYVLWHLNDGWPGATSSLRDSEGAEKPAYFIARRANAPEGVRLAFEGAAATAQATGKALDLSLRILDAGGKVLALQQGAGPLRAAFPPGAAYAVAENGPHRVIRPLPALFLPDDPRLGRSAYSIGSEPPAKGEFAVTHLLTVKAEGVVVGLCLEPTRANAWARDGMIDLLPGERHEFRASIPKDCRDWREAFKARSWHDLAGK